MFCSKDPRGPYFKNFEQLLLISYHSVGHSHTSLIFGFKDYEPILTVVSLDTKY